MLIEQEIVYNKKERYYVRNFISLCVESFFFSFALTMFSAETVLPVYVENLSANPVCLALISTLYYGMSYLATVFSCVIGVKARSPKWISVIICFLQRIGFFLIFLSTYLATKNAGQALLTFFISLTMYSVSAGMSNPLFAQMVSTSIHRGVGVFYGSYNLIGAGSGVAASLILARLLVAHPFPFSFRRAFLFGLISALIATVVVCVGVKEVTDDREVERISLKDLLSIGRDILKSNLNFRNFTILKVLMGAAEFAIPYYIIEANELAEKPSGFVGIMATVFLVAKMLGSLVMGRLSDRFGAISVMRYSCACGAIGAFLAITLKSWQAALIMYAFLAFAINGILMAANVACITYSHNRRTPIYTATVSLLCAPLYIFSSFGGAGIVNRFSSKTVFTVACLVYSLGTILSFKLKEKRSPEGRACGGQS